MAVEIVTPEDYMGNVSGDISSRRGVILGMEDAPSGKLIESEVPLGRDVWLLQLLYEVQLRAERPTAMQFKKYAEGT